VGLSSGPIRYAIVDGIDVHDSRAHKLGEHVKLFRLPASMERLESAMH
jgi:hypothetical protein